VATKGTIVYYRTPYDAQIQWSTTNNPRPGLRGEWPPIASFFFSFSCVDTLKFEGVYTATTISAKEIHVIEAKQSPQVSHTTHTTTTTTTTQHSQKLTAHSLPPSSTSIWV
jgi:hypothetical protein